MRLAIGRHIEHRTRRPGRSKLAHLLEKRLCPHKKLLLAYIAENSTVESKQFLESLDAWQRCPAD